MEKIRAADLANLPITDPVHVAKEINWWLRYKEVNQAEKKRRSIYMQVYWATKKIRNYERREQNTPAR